MKYSYIGSIGKNDVNSALASKNLFQAYKNLFPDQGAKKKSAEATNGLSNHKLSIPDFILQLINKNQKVALVDLSANFDKNETLPNTYTAFMGEFTPEVIAFKQLAPIMKMDLALLGPAYRWMILIYGVPQLYAPKKWMKFVNIKATSSDKANGLYY